MNRALTSSSAHSRRGPIARLGDWLPALVPFVATRRLRVRVTALTEALQWQSGTDPLTGLPNRAALLDELRDRAALPGDTGLALINLDGLDSIRATLGYDQGDALVLATVERITGVLGPQAFVARLDGGELVVVRDAALTGEPIDRLASRLLGLIAAPHGLLGGEVVTTASIGMAESQGDGPDSWNATELLREAASALGQARAAGPGRTAWYRHDLDEAAITDLRLAAELRRAIPDRELEVYYQPIVSLPDRQLAGAEALIRWNHPLQGVLTPDRWLDVADNAGLLPEIGRATLDEVCRRFATVSARTPERALRIAVNLAPSELRHPDLVPAVSAILERSGLDPTQLVIEVSDRAVLDDGAAAAIHELRHIGVRIALDDFGTGLAAIGRLGHLPIDELKLDDSVVAKVATPGAEQSVLESIIGLCQRLGIDVIAEGVSTERDSDALAALGCRFAQGWMFGRPLPFSRFVALLDRMAQTERVDSVDPAAPTSAAGEAGQTLGQLP